MSQFDKYLLVALGVGMIILITWIVFRIATHRKLSLLAKYEAAIKKNCELEKRIESLRGSGVVDQEYYEARIEELNRRIGEMQIVIDDQSHKLRQAKAYFQHQMAEQSTYSQQ